MKLITLITIIGVSNVNAQYQYIKPRFNSNGTVTRGYYRSTPDNNPNNNINNQYNQGRRNINGNINNNNYDIYGRDSDND